MPSKKGFGNTRKKGSTYKYGVDSKNPIMMKSPMRDEKVVQGGTLPTVTVSGGKGGGKKKYNAYEQGIQKETDLVLKKSINKTRKQVEQEVRNRRAQ